MKNSLIEKIKALPPLPKTIIDINKVYADEEASVGDMAKVVEHDPMIVANLLKAANSPLFGLKKTITSVAQAVSFFGMSRTRSISIHNSMKKLLNVDLQPYGITSEDFAEISTVQANLMMKWYSHIDRVKAEKLYLATFLQETGKILIASDVIQEDEAMSFKSEIEMTANIAMIEKSYVDVTSAEVTASIFEHWGFDKDFINMIRFSDNPAAADDDIKEFAIALNIIKTIVPVNDPLSDIPINFGLKKAENAGYDVSLLKTAIDETIDYLDNN